jgi:hypothetical protein
MMQGGIAFNVSCIQRALVLDQKLDHGHRANGCRTMNRVLSTAIAYTCRSRGFVLEKQTGNIEILLGSNEVEDCLCVITCGMSVIITSKNCKSLFLTCPAVSKSPVLVVAHIDLGTGAYSFRRCKPLAG